MANRLFFILMLSSTSLLWKRRCIHDLLELDEVSMRQGALCAYDVSQPTGAYWVLPPGREHMTVNWVSNSTVVLDVVCQRCFARHGAEIGRGFALTIFQTNSSLL